MINIEPIKAFSDNYIWLVTTNEGSIVIDPGEAGATIKFLKDNTLDLKAVLITHHHFDHTGGIVDLISTYPVKDFGPKNDIPSGRQQWNCFAQLKDTNKRQIHDREGSDQSLGRINQKLFYKHIFR